jgi:NAD(P)-dependent dehydrogenase (short-subunit alcohol dehydrogenase family)
MKSAQIELAHILDAELENTGLISFSIHPGTVRTPGSEIVANKIAALHQQEKMRDVLPDAGPSLPVEVAGAAIAAAIALAPRHRGKDVSALQALREAGIPFDIL